MLQLLKNKSYLLLWLTIPLIFVILLVMGNQSISVQIHDTYLVFPPLFLGLFYALLFGLFGLIYRLLQPVQLLGWMTNLHVLLTLVGSGFIIWQIIYFSYNESVTMGYNVYSFLQQFSSIFFLFFVAAQLLFVINIIIGSLRFFSTK